MGARLTTNKGAGMNTTDEMMNQLNMDIDSFHWSVKGLSNDVDKMTSAIKGVLELHEIISVKENKIKKDLCILCEETYPCETVGVILRNFGWIIPQ
jgi:hypothetical protein